MAKTIEDLFFYLTFIFDFFIILLVLISSKTKKIKKEIWFIFSYCILNSLTNYLSTLYSYEEEYFLYAFFTLLEYSIFAFFLAKTINKSLISKLIFSLSCAFLIFVLLHTFTSKSDGLDSIPIGIETILILIYSFYYLYLQINIVDETFIYSRYQFWIIVGFMVYLGGSFFIYILANNVSYDVLKDYWFLTYAFYIIKNILFGVGLYTYAKSSKRKYSQKFQPSLN